MKYEYIDKEEQLRILQNEIRIAEEQHFKLSLQAANLTKAQLKDSALAQDMNNLEERINTFKDRLAEVTGTSRKKVSRAQKRSQAVEKAEEILNSDDTDNS